MEEHRSFKKHKEDEEMMKRMSQSIGNVNQDLSVNEQIWNLSTIKFLRLEELELINGIVLRSEYSSKILEKCRDLCERMLVCSDVRVSVQNLQQRQGVKEIKKPDHVDSAWSMFYTETIMRNLIELNKFLQNYLLYLQEQKLVVDGSGSGRNLNRSPLMLFSQKTYQETPRITQDASASEFEAYLKWVLNEIMEIKIQLGRVVIFLKAFKKAIENECHRIEETNGSLEKLLSNPGELEKFGETLRGRRTYLFHFLLEGEKDGKKDREEDGGKSNYQTRFHQFI